MKFKQFAPVLAIACFCSLTAFAENMQVLDQAGDIAEGNPFNFLEHNYSIASYYKNGTSGDTTFNCILVGKNAKAMLYPGKNFEGNPVAILEVGINGPYTWKLIDKGANNGNIKIKYLRGESAVVQCKEIK